jgi:hypothetical protein
MTSDDASGRSSGGAVTGVTGVTGVTDGTGVPGQPTARRGATEGVAALDHVGGTVVGPAPGAGAPNGQPRPICTACRSPKREDPEPDTATAPRL